MDKQASHRIIQETFENPFDKEQFTYFVRNLLNTLDQSKARHFGGYVKDMFSSVVKTYERLGTYTDPDGNKIDVIVVYLQKSTSVDRARATQRNFAARYLKDRGEKEAGLFAYVAPDNADWRFSLVKMDYKFEETAKGKMKVKEDFTPARRWSFLVGSNERSHTAQSRLVGILAKDEQDPTLSDLEQAFNIETVTDEFFRKYRDLFLRTKEELDQVLENDPKIKADFETKGLDTVNFAKKLLGQIVFLYFLQKKGWFGVESDGEWGSGSKRFLRELFEGKGCHGYNNFFNDILEPLFYKALREKRANDYFDLFGCKIPFLNGGLFDPISGYDWESTDIYLPDDLFSDRTEDSEGTGILDVFDLFNFTVKEDEPLEKEVAIDPELLGKAYEKFNAIRPDNFDEFKKAIASGRTGAENKFNKKFGVYYTPREIVHYMCQQSLINYLANSPNNASTTYEKLGDPNLDMYGNETKKGQLDITAKHKTTLDIPKEDIETFIQMGEQLRENEVRVLQKGKETSTYTHKIPETIRRNATLIDRKLEGITVCDPAVGSGAFPVGMMKEIVSARKVLSVFIDGNSATHAPPSEKNHRQKTHSTYELKRGCIEHSLYGVDIDPGAVEVAKLRLWLSLVVDEDDISQIQPLPNLGYKIVCGNSLLGVEKTLFNQELFRELERLKPLYFEETDPLKKKSFKEQIVNLICKITDGHTEFDFEVYFSEVFHNKQGFDVVIGNPPYGADLSHKEKKHLKSKYKKDNSAVKNSAIYFIYLSDEILNRSGINSFIVPKSLCYSAGWRNCASLVRKGLDKLIDSGKAFESVKLEQVIFIRRRSDSSADYVNGKYLNNRVEEFTTISKNIYDQYKVLLTGQTRGEMELILKIVDRCERTWSDYVFVERGLNWQSKSSQCAEQEKGNIYRGAQLYPYFIDCATDKISINHFSKSKYSYLHRPKILNQLAIAHVQNPYPHFYLQATLDTENKLVFETISCSFQKSDSVDMKFLLALNNSKLFAWILYKFIYSNAIRSTRYDMLYVGKAPCPELEDVDDKPIIEFVDQIFSITKTDGYAENLEAQSIVKNIMRKIDQEIYELYGLNDDEIAIVEGAPHQ